MSLVKYEYEKLAKYPHMLARDIKIWEAFIDTHPDWYQEVAYDVKVGKGVEVPDEYPGNIKRDALALTRKRIDVVGWTAGGVDVIEVKPYAGLSAVGQVLSYRELLIRDRAPGVVVRPVIVTDVLQSDLELVCSRLGIVVYVVE